MQSSSCPRLSGSKPLFGEQSDAVKVSETFCLEAKVAAKPSEGVSVSRSVKNENSVSKMKNVFYRTALNTCLSFLNGRKKWSGIAL